MTCACPLLYLGLQQSAGLDSSVDCQPVAVFETSSLKLWFCVSYCNQTWQGTLLVESPFPHEKNISVWWLQPLWKIIYSQLEYHSQSMEKCSKPPSRFSGDCQMPCLITQLLIDRIYIYIYIISVYQKLSVQHLGRESCWRNQLLISISPMCCIIRDSFTVYRLPLVYITLPT